MQIKILSLSDEQEGIRVTLHIKNGEKSYKKSIRINEDDYSSIGSPSVDSRISEADYKALCRRAKKTGALDDALRILSYGDNNKATLVRKLTSRGYDQKSASEVADGLCKAGYINESDQAYRYVLSLANTKMMGPKKIYPYLLCRGYKKEDIDEGISQAISRKELDFSKIKTALILKYRPQDDEEEKKLLYKHGFSFGDVD